MCSQDRPTPTTPEPPLSIAPAVSPHSSIRTPDDPEGYLTLLELFTTLDRHLVNAVRGALEPHHLHYNDFIALRSISLGRADTPSLLSRVTGITLPATSELIDRLVGQGWVVRSPSPTDRRSYRLELTDSGRATYRESSATIHQTMSALCERFPAEARHSLEAGILELWQSAQAASPAL
ncbi:MAG: MarR family winged helix-turn-helix transcriptional regulator [Thermoplasmata archaeon]